MQLPSFVWVINTGKATHQDRYNGEEFNFYANDPVLIPEEVAFTLFGFGEDNKSRCLLRLGWIQSNDASTKAYKNWLGFISSGRCSHRRQDCNRPVAMGITSVVLPRART